MSIIPTVEEMQDQARDAARWRALLNSGRLRIVGSAGFDHLSPAEPRCDTDYLHFGMEFWSSHDSRAGSDQAKDMLTNYADFLINRKTNR